jgi:hypothetical protein
MLARMGQNRSTYVLLMEKQISTTTMESSMALPKKLKIELPYDPVIPILGI